MNNDGSTRIFRLSKNQRIKNAMYEYVRDNPKVTTREILFYVNNKYKHGTTPQQIKNYLHLDGRFLKVGIERLPGFYSNSRNSAVSTWVIKEGF